jgi:hypothetical protein
MTIESWIPTALLLVAWMIKSIIDARLQKAVQHEYDAKLATLNSQLRAAEERFKVELNAKEQSIQALRDTSLAGMAARRAVTDKRRQEAIDQLWDAIHRLGFAKVAAQWMAAVKFEPALKEAVKNPRMRMIFETIKLPEEMGAEAFALAHRARPHVSPLAWAFFAAWQAVVTHSTVQLKLLQSGADVPGAVDNTRVVSSLKLALPHHAAYLDQYGTSGAYHLLEELETRLLEELRNSLDGTHQDDDSLKHARRILKEVNKGASVVPTEIRNMGQAAPAP